MAGFRTYTTVLDACVLYPGTLRDLMLSIAFEGVYHARWSDDIHDEWIRNLLKNRPDLNAEKLNSIRVQMDKSIDDCLIYGYQPIIDVLSLPDPDDRHVLAAAVIGHADAIVTFNKKDFPESELSKFGIEVLHPDDFLISQYDLNTTKLLKAVKSMRSRRKKPPQTAQEFIDILERQGLPQFCSALRDAEYLI